MSAIDRGLDEHLRKEFRKCLNDWADTVAGGGCQTWEQYKFLTGQIAGMAIAERIYLDATTLAEEKENG